MLRAVDVAKFFLYLMQDEKNLTNMKLNKLLYFAQGYFLKRTGKPLFSDEILAWPDGPVVGDVYSSFKSFGSSAIEYNEHLDIKMFNDEETQVMLDVARELGKYTTRYLVDETHKKGSPWSQYYKEKTLNVIIPKEDIKSYFDSIPDIEEKEIIFSDDEFVGYRDEEGYLVLPKDYED